METHQRILILQTAFLGDVILTLPLVEAVRSLWPDARIDFLVRASYVGFLEGHKGIDTAIPFDKRKLHKGLGGMLNLARKLSAVNYDLALIPHRSFRSGLIAAMSGIRKRVGFSKVAGSLWYTNSVPRNLEAHEGERNLALLDVFEGARSQDWDVRPWLDLEGHPAADEVTDWLDEAELPRQKRIVVLAPGSVWETKRWPEGHWTKLVRQIETDPTLVPVMVGGPEDRDLCIRIRDASGGTVYNAAGQLSVAGSAALIARADLLITGDTAPLHLAQAVRTKTLAIFGPTVPDFGFAPTGAKDRIIGLDLPCRPCAIHGSRECPLGHHHCMLWLDAGMVWKTAQDMLATSNT